MTSPRPSPGKNPPLRGGTFQRLLTIGICTVAGVAFIAVGGLTDTLRSREIRADRFERLEIERDQKIDAIAHWLEKKRADLELMSTSPLIVNGAQHNQIDPTLSRRLATDRLRAIAKIQGMHGALLVSSHTGELLASSYPADEEPHRLEDTLRLRAERSGASVRSDVTLCPVHRNPVITLAKPVRAKVAGPVLAVLAFVVDPTKELYEGILESGLTDETTEALLVDQSAIAQSPLRFDRDAVAALTIAAEPARRAAAGQTGRIATTDYRNVPVMAAYGHVPYARWGIVVKQDLIEIEAPVLRMAREVVAVSAAVLLGSVLLGLLIARRLSQAAAEIARVADEAGAGDLRVRATQAGPRELQRIARNLNLLIDRVASQLTVDGAIHDIYSAASASERLDELMDATLPRLMAATRSQIGVFYETEPNGAHLRLRAARGVTQDRLLTTLGLNPPTSVLAESAVTRKVCVQQDLPPEIALTITTQAGQAPPRGLLAIPLLWSTQSVGVIGLASLYNYRDDDRAIAEILCENFGQSVSVCRANEELATLNQELRMQTAALEDQTDELRAQRIELQQSDRMKSEFLSNMSHELRTPLNSILALSQLMQTRGTGVQLNKDREYLQIIERNGRLLLSLINDILDLSKIEAGRMEVVAETLDVSSTVDNVLLTVRPLAEEKGLALRVDCDRSLPRVASDPEKVERILLNLLSNAVKFTDRGKVHLRAILIEGVVRFSVEDTGVGIPGSEGKHVFEAFRQANGSLSRTCGGTGLGLPISRKLARLLGGDIWFESIPGSGSTFYFDLPHDGHDDETSLDLTPIKNIAVITDGAPLVLLVEDNKVSAFIIKTILDKRGYRVITATDGGTALRLALDRWPTVLILDLMLPTLDGLEVLRRLRSHPETANMQIVVIASKVLSLQEKTELESLGVKRFMRKGNIARREVIATVDGLVRAAGATVPKPVAEGPELMPTGCAILMVEDNPDNLLTMTAVLEDLGCRLLVAHDGLEAVDQATQETPALIFMDIQLPGVDGVEAMRRIRSRPGGDSVPIVAVTAKAMKGDRGRLLAAGFDDYLSKPIEPERLLEIARQYLASPTAWDGNGES